MDRQWIYVLNLWKNPIILKTVFKIILIAFSVPILFLLLLESNRGLEAMRLVFFEVSPILFGIAFALLIIAYILTALILGGEYCVVFIMNEIGIHHIQMEKQFKKAQVLSLLNVITGILTGNLQTLGSGLITGSKRSSYTEFSSITKITIHKKRHVVYLNAPFNKNQVYINQEDFETISSFIINRCPNAILRFK